MQEIKIDEIEKIAGGGLTPNEGAGLILALGAIGGPATFAFAFPIAAALYIAS